MTRQELLREALEVVDTWLSDEGIWHCLAFGTLLGAVRDADVISWDHDLDLFIRPCDVPRILEAITVHSDLSYVPRFQSGAGLALRPGGSGGVDQQKLPIVLLKFKEAFIGELWAPVLFDDGVLRLYDLEAETYMWPHSSFPAFFAERLRTVEVAGRAYPVFAEAEAWLSGTYGEDWRTPRRSAADGGEWAAGWGWAGDVTEPKLAGQIAWCEARGWDRTRYRDQPRWPRELRGAGPCGYSARASGTSASDWWRSLDEVSAFY